MPLEQKHPGIDQESSAPIDTSTGIVIRKRVYLDDLDAYGMVHHARYPLLFDNAVLDFWHDAGWVADATVAVQAVRELTLTYHAPVVGIGDVDVHLWVDRVGRSSISYRFQVLSPDHTVRYAEGGRVLINLDPQTRRPSPIPDDFWEKAVPLLAAGVERPAA